MAVARGQTAAERYIKRIFDDDVEQGSLQVGQNNQIDKIWRHCKFFMALAMSDPAVAFLLSKGSTIQNAVYWRPDDCWYNPKLQKEDAKPLAMLWVLASRTFGHPWTGPEPTISVKRRGNNRLKKEKTRTLPLFWMHQSTL